MRRYLSFQPRDGCRSKEAKEQRQPFRFRLPWLSAPLPPPPQPRPTPASATETVPVQRFLFRPPEIAQTEAPQRAEQIEVASPPSSPIRPPTQFRAVFTSPLLSPRVPKEPVTDSASQPQSPRLSIEATSPRTVSLPSSPAIQVQSMSPLQSASDLSTNRQENQSPKLIVPLEEPKPGVSHQQSYPKAESKADINSKVNPSEPSVKSNAVAISEDAKGEAKKERRELEKEEKPETVQKTISELLTEGPKSHTKDLHGKLFPLNKEQTARRKDERKDKKHVKAQSLTNPKEKTSSREQPQESKEDEASPQRELREDITKFVHSLTSGLSSAEIPVNIVTLIGDNRGASMQIDSGSAKREESIHIHRGYKIYPDESTEITSEEIESSDQRNKAPIIEEEETKTFINSNAQGINDSIVFDSSITERNPGVHLVFDSVEPNEEIDKSGLEARKAEFTISKAEKHTYEPTVRRRCLRGLFMESSDSDEDGSEKPRRHGCRYNCRDKEFGEV